MTSRSSHRRCFVKKGVLKNISKFTRKQLCWSLFFNKVAGLQACNFAKKRLVFSCKICENFEITYFKEHLRTAAFGQIEFFRTLIILNFSARTRNEENKSATLIYVHSVRFDSAGKTSIRADIYSIFDFCKIKISADLVTFTEKILNEKLHFLCSVRQSYKHFYWALVDVFF